VSVAVDRDRTVRIVNHALSRNYNALSLYVLNSSPWSTDADTPALEAFQAVADAEAATASWLTVRLREDFKAGPTVRAFEYWNLDLNFLSVPYLVTFAHAHYEKVAGEYETLLKEAGDDAALKPILTRLRDEAKSHARTLARHLPA